MKGRVDIAALTVEGAAGMVDASAVVAMNRLLEFVTAGGPNALSP